MPAKKKTAKKVSHLTVVKRPRGRPATGKQRICPMPHVKPDFYMKLQSIAKAQRTSIARAAEYAIDLAHLQTFHM